MRKFLLLSLLLLVTGCATCPLTANGPTGSRVGNIFLNHAVLWPSPANAVVETPFLIADLIQYAGCL